MGKFDIYVKKIWTFWKHLGKGYNITFALNSSVSSFCFFTQIYIVYIPVADWSQTGFCADYFVLPTILIAAGAVQQIFLTFPRGG